MRETEKEIKKFLQSVSDSISNLQELRNEYWEMGKKITEVRATNYERISSRRGNTSHWDDHIVSHLSMEDVFYKRREELCELLIQFENMIDPLPSYSRRVLRAKYMSNRTWEDIADEFECSLSHIYLTLSNSIKELASIKEGKTE